MKSELSAFLDTIDTPAFRRANLAKVRAKAAAARRGPGLVPAAVPLAGLGRRGAPFQVPSRSGEWVQRRPYYMFSGGPNGAGKSTLFARFQETARQPVEQVNGDVLQQLHPQLSGFEVAELTAARIKELLAARASFSIENNLATADNYKLIRGAKAAGCRVELVYVGLDSVPECWFRVQQRVREGGHEVPPAIVEQRYHQSLSLLKQHYTVFDHIRLVDNTDRAVGYQTAAVIENGRVQQLPPVSAGWAAGIVRHIQLRERFMQS